MSTPQTPNPTIQRELTHGVSGACLCLSVHRAARSLARRFDQALRPVGLTNGQFSLIMALNQAGPAGMGAIAALLALDRTTLTAALKPLVARGLVRVRVDPGDRRGRLLSLTGAGEGLLALALPIWERAHAATEAVIGEAGVERFRRDLGAVTVGRGE